MKTNYDQPAGRRISDAKRGDLAEYEFRRIPAVDASEQHLSWFSSYDEEWEAFVKKQALLKNRAGFSSNEPESLPRVWNCPQRV